MNRATRRVYLLLGILPPCILGIITGIANRSRIAHIIRTIHRPPLTLPIFWIVVFWLALYVLLGYATSLILQARIYSEERINALVVAGGQLVMNSLYVFVFFNLHIWGLGFLIQVMFLGLVGINGILYYRIHRLAGLLLIPYFLFGFYTCYLTIVTIFFN